MAEQHVWYYLKEGLVIAKEEGPFTEPQLMALARSGQLKQETKLRSPTRTSNKEINAGSFPKLAELISQAKIEADAKAQAIADQKKAEKEEIKKRQQNEKHLAELKRQDELHQRNIAAMEAREQAEHQALVANQHTMAQAAAAPQVYILNQQAPPSTTLPAILNLFFPPFGQLVQGRVIAFFLWLGIMLFSGFLVVLLGLFTAGIGLLAGFVVGPVFYILCILDAAWYKG